jgi:deoxyribodipyrimidine photolyase-related protein
MKKVTLRLILGDQLNASHSWFSKTDQDVVYLMAEMRQETDYVVHHIQKVVGYFSAMRNFAETLKREGHQVTYLTLDHESCHRTLSFIIEEQLAVHKALFFEYLEPDEYRLDKQLKEICRRLLIPAKCYDTEHFYTSKNTLKDFFIGKKQYVMEPFYRMMRKKHRVLMEGDKPLGDKWNFDQENRNKWKGQPAIPALIKLSNNVSEVYALIRKHHIKTIGQINDNCFEWPISLEQSEQLLENFCTYLLKDFGNYQDAMHTQEKFLFHSRISFALNTKMISPQRVIKKVIETYENQIFPEVSLNQVEGFVRQILGWREYMRGIYWMEMPSYGEKNILENNNKLPDFYWTANTKMNCLHHAIKQSLETSYAHHIQRLMVTGNYALLTQTNPDFVDQWYLGVYIDAIEWVEMPNTRGMSQWADGGIVATKPYVSSGNYIQKMSNYCESCQYNYKEKTGESACPFNSLYWNFLDEKKAYFKSNHRMSMMLSLLNKMDTQQLIEIKKRAQHIIANPDLY